MDDQYILTVIISNYNQEKHIAETIDSVLAQRVNFPFQIIITDDCSLRDRSRDVIRTYENKYDCIKAIYASENKGYLSNILRAKERAKTKYLCLLDADDYWTDFDFLQRAYDFLENHNEYSIYEANVKVISEIPGEENRHIEPCVSPKIHAGTYSKEMLIRNQEIPITQTTGMIFRNSIFINGIPEILTNAVGTRSERSFEGDLGRFMMHLKEGLAYYDQRIVGVYRITEDGLWSGQSEAKKIITNARSFLDYYQYYGTGIDFFVNKAYGLLQQYFTVKHNELVHLEQEDEFIDEYERLRIEDVYRFCKEHENEISITTQYSLAEKVMKRIRNIGRQKKKDQISKPG